MRLHPDRGSETGGLAKNRKRRLPIGPMAQQTIDLHVNPSDETIQAGLLTVRFLLTADDSSGSIAAFEVTVPGAQRLLAPAHSHDHYEETV